MIIKAEKLIYSDSIMERISIARDVQHLCVSLSMWISYYDKELYPITERDINILKNYNYEVLDKALTILKSKNNYNEKDMVIDLYKYLYIKFDSILHKLNQPLDFINRSAYNYSDLRNYIVNMKNTFFGFLCKYDEKCYSDNISTAVNKSLEGLDVLRFRLLNNYAKIEAGKKLYNFIVSIRNICIHILDDIEIEIE